MSVRAAACICTVVRMDGALIPRASQSAVRPARCFPALEWVCPMTAGVRHISATAGPTPTAHPVQSVWRPVRPHGRSTAGWLAGELPACRWRAPGQGFSSAKPLPARRCALKLGFRHPRRQHGVEASAVGDAGLAEPGSRQRASGLPG